jgi:hypothetical protein
VDRCFRALDQSIADNAPQALAKTPGKSPRALRPPVVAPGNSLPVSETPAKTFERGGDSVLAVAADATRVFAGSQAGTIHVFSLQTGKIPIPGTFQPSVRLQS